MDKEAFVKIKEFKTEVEEDIPLDMLLFFGSRTTDHYRNDSDIDLMIVSEGFKGVNVLDRVAKMYDYWTFMCPVDFICFTPEEFNERKNRFSIVSEALATGVAV
ncbi:MAG: nucleotidyltransferase [Thermoplasmata archaeon HGW-Thermoplasmata-1]|nr:MAG: nucleotidyltransferase [Thermoplasmata archaeon HGW-Thermoplasmata-1]